KAQVPGQFWDEFSFTKDAIAKQETFELSFPIGKYVKIVSPEFKPQVSEKAERKIYRWTHSNLIVKVKEPGEMPRRIPPNPDIQITTFRSWEEVGRWYGDLQKEPLQVTPAIQLKANELTKGLKTDEEKTQAIYNFVALKLHYIGLDFGIGRYQPHAADDVLDNGYGDCKDKHTLMAALLKASGVDAWPALIHATRKLDPDVPSPAQFNHVITVVPQGENYLWLDTTPEVAPYGMLLLGLRGKQALVIPSNSAARLMTTPENAPFEQQQSFSMEGKLNADGSFAGHAEQSYRGDSEVIFRSLFRQVSESQWKEAVQRLSYRLNFGGDVSNVTMTQPDDLSKPFHLSYDYERKHYSDWDNRQITPPIPPLGVEMSLDSKKPGEPVLLGGLGKVIYRAKVTLPSGYAGTAPANVDLVRPYAEYHATYSIDHGVFSATRRFVIKKQQIELGSWEDYRDFGKAISDDENKYVRLDGAGASTGGESDGSGNGKDPGEILGVFTQGTIALQQRDFQKAQELFEKIIAKDPNYKGVHFNLGLALVARGRTEDAIGEFRKEEKISPENQRSYQVVAAFLMRTGRRDEAMEEWRKLLKVDPGNRTAASSLAGLLYQAERYPEAVSVLEAAVKAAPDSSGLQYQLGEAYIKTKQNDKAVATFQKVMEQKSDDPETLNNVAYTLAENNLKLDLAQQYAEKAVRQLEEQAGGKPSDDTALHVTFDFSLVWDTLGWVYFQQGDVRRAEPLVRSAWLLGEDSLVAEHLGEIYEKEGKTEQAAHAYESALAVSSVPASSFGISPDAARAYQARADEIRNQYRKLTGKGVPLAEIKRLPNGEWTKTPAEQLRASREVRLSNEEKLSGSADFVIEFEPEKVDSVQYLSGGDELENLTKKLKAAHYPLEFPPNSQAILAVRVSVRCQPGSCVGTLVVPTPQSQFAVPQ
ncbi:MAG TPA: tetratricopeptide repeat protein, partial [Candidatus Sulfotelmatobacter sp.]|nr:tetratricopeptide repeat protein [Candidatus Sulfotelmatobacter sp.]